MYSHFFKHLQRSNSSWFLLHPNVFVSSCELSTASATSQSGRMEPVGTRCYGWMFDSLRVFPQKIRQNEVKFILAQFPNKPYPLWGFRKKGWHPQANSWKNKNMFINPLWVSINHSNHLTPTSQNKNKCPSASASGSGLESILPTDFHLRRLHGATCVWLPCLSPTTGYFRLTSIYSQIITSKELRND